MATKAGVALVLTCRRSEEADGQGRVSKEGAKAEYIVGECALLVIDEEVRCGDVLTLGVGRASSGDEYNG